jgi:uncharacterized Zn finger protein (UPF0148 family)
MSNFFHRLLHPHCPECNAERLEKKVCSSCETLRSLLESEKQEKQQLLNSILEKPKVEEPRTVTQEEIRPKYIPWRVKQQILEQEDRKKAELLKKKNEELEAELGKEEINAG